MAQLLFLNHKTITMSKALTLLFLISCLCINAQQEDFTGTYIWKSSTNIHTGKGTQESQITRILTVKNDGTFTFDRLRPAWGNNAEDNIYGKGTWTPKGKYIYFNTDTETELDEKYTLNFTNTKGRWDAPKNRLILYESDISWLNKFAINKM